MRIFPFSIFFVCLVILSTPGVALAQSNSTGSERSYRIKTPIFESVSNSCTAGCRGERGPQGSAGPQGPTGPQGPQGEAGECVVEHCGDQNLYFVVNEIDAQCGPTNTADVCLAEPDEIVNGALPWPECEDGDQEYVQASVYGARGYELRRVYQIDPGPVRRCRGPRITLSPGEAWRGQPAPCRLVLVTTCIGIESFILDNY